MTKAGTGAFRARLVVELAEEDRADIESWLAGQIDPDEVEMVRGRRLWVVISELAGRQPKRLGSQAEELAACGHRRLALRPGPSLEARPSRRQPRLIVLPFDAYGPLLAAVAEILKPVPGLRMSAAPRMSARLFMPVGVIRGAQAADDGDGDPWPVPRKWPSPLPIALRRPMDAVRLAVYPSKTTSESRELTPLTQVELPRAAAVR